MDQITQYGILWENWQPKSFIGAGNFGTVYLARNTEDTSKTCAVKMITVKNRDLGIRTDETIGEEMLQEKIRSAACKEMREISLMEQLRSCRNTVTIHNYRLIPGIHDITILLQMDYLTPLGEQIKKSLPSRDEVIRLGIDLCHALSECEKHQIIHRDIKPDNIFVDASGTYQLGDFGFSRTLELSTSLNSSLRGRKGTPLYMAPECWDFKKTASYRSDQYALGIVLYQLLNHGRTPFCDDMYDIDAVNDSINRRLDGEELPAPASEDGELWQIIKKACEPDENLRFSTAEAFGQALSDLVEKETALRIIPLSEHMQTRHLTKEAVVRMAVELCEELEKLEQEKYIHCSIRPDHILINDEGSCRLLKSDNACHEADIRARRMAQNEEDYMAPEGFNQLQKVSYQTDQYALGIVLYQLLNNGKLPFCDDMADSASRQAAREHKLYDEEELPAPADEDGKLWQIVKKACELEESKRYSNASEMKKALMGLPEFSAAGGDTLHLILLSEYMKRRNLTREAIIRMAIELCEELENLEQEKYIHCSIRPDHILVNDEGSCRLLKSDNACHEDDVRARKTAQNEEDYMAPEGFNRLQKVSYQTDQYALGIVLYQLLNDGKLPFCDDMENPASRQAAREHRLYDEEELPAPAGEDGKLWQIIKKACELEESKRYSNAAEMKKALLELYSLAEKETALHLIPLPEHMETRHLTREAIIQMAIGLCAELEKLEQEKYIHCSIRPDHILVNDEGSCRLLKSDNACHEDDIHARRTAQNEEDYMAPEGFNRLQKVSYQTDQYALGIVLYQLLNDGKLPFCDNMENPASRQAALERKLYDEEELPAPAGEDGKLWQIIKKACELEESKRYSSASEMKKALMELSDHSSSTQETGEVQQNQKDAIQTIAFETVETAETEEATETVKATETVEKEKKKPSAVLMKQKDFNSLKLLTRKLFHKFPVNKIKKVQFLDSLANAPWNANDLSEKQNRSVLGWLENGTFFIAGDGGVVANKDSTNLFSCCINLKYIDFNNCFDTQNVTDMSRMFYGCSALTSLDVSGFHTQNVTNMSRMFYGCSSLTSLDVSGFHTQNVTDMHRMFSNCSALTSLDVSGFHTQNVTDMSGMFSYCSALTSLDVSGFHTQNVTDMSDMFSCCNSSLQETCKAQLKR